MNRGARNKPTDMSPQEATLILQEGNKRFVANTTLQKNLKDQVEETRTGQYPFAVILGCIDSRVSAELIFDQGIGDIFSIRVAGNVVNADVLGSMEYACKVAGAKVVVVMGHTMCGAVTSACRNVKLGNITSLLTKIKPAVDVFYEQDMDEDTIEKVAVRHVKLSIERIRNESPILLEMEENAKITILGAMYSVSTGKIDFL